MLVACTRLPCRQAAGMEIPRRSCAWLPCFVTGKHSMCAAAAWPRCRALARHFLTSGPAGVSWRPGLQCVAPAWCRTPPRCAAGSPCLHIQSGQDLPPRGSSFAAVKPLLCTTARDAGQASTVTVVVIMRSLTHLKLS